MSQTIKKSDLEIILSGAAALQTRDVSAEAIRDLQGIGETDYLPESVVYELGETLMIPKGYIGEYLQTRFPSFKRQAVTLNELGAIPSSNALRGTYITELVNELRKKSPLDLFSILEGSLFREHNEKVIGKSFFGRKRIREVNRAEWLASVYVGYWGNSFIMDINIASPFFSEVCKDKLIELKERFSHLKWDRYKVVHDYSIPKTEEESH